MHLADFRVNDEVEATRSFGGVARESISAGTRGIVVASGGGVLSKPVVEWHVKGLFRSKYVTTEVEDGEAKLVRRP